MLYTDLLIPAANFLRDVEMHGMVYDVDAAADLFELELRPEMNALTKDMRDIIGKSLFSPGSPQQCAALYYDEWGVTHAMQERPDMRRSTDASAREEILNDRFQHKHGDKATILAFTEKLHRWKRVQKQTSTYILALIKAAIQDPEQRVYTSLNLHTTVTGRLSSTGPNLQNITRAKDDLPNIRNLFVAAPGKVIVQADYSQAELRVIAHLSDDRELLRIYNEGLDLHSEVATMFYGENYTSEQRTQCKSMNFGVAYRQTAKTFQEKHGIPEREGKKFIDWWWSRFRAVAEWERGIERRIHKEGYLESPFGRRRRFHLLTEENRQGSYREGINFYPQSIASDFTLLSGMAVAQKADIRRANVCLLVHDSIIAEVEESYAEEYSDLVLSVMEETPRNTLNWATPFTSDVGVGASWGSAK